MKRSLRELRLKLSNVKNKINLGVKKQLFKTLKGNVECNICGWKDFKLKSNNWHHYIICPNCGSKVRHRLFFAIINHSNDLNIDNLITDKKILHFAPHKSIYKSLKAKAKEYKTADLLAEGYSYSHIDYNIDMTNMSDIEEGSFDCVIAFDVLEHIPNHIEAIQEACRVLRKGGYCIFTVPQKDGLEKTFEDLTITDPKRRSETFGQSDHWRIYGSDFKDMIERAGFQVFVRDEKSLDKEIVSRNVLYPPILSQNPLATNNRKIYFGRKV